jgi:outer membrane biosynthesis protein TonB
MRLRILFAALGLSAGPGVIFTSVPSAALQTQPVPTAARLQAGARVPLAPAMAVGGGEVVLDVLVSTSGAVAKVLPVRATPPFTDLMTSAVKGWRFDGARAAVKGALQPAEGHVLVAAVFRPPQVYAAPALGGETKVVGQLSPSLPQPGVLTMPAAYPPRAVRDGTVLIEIELSAAAMPSAHKVLSPASVFDAAALETVKGWRFGFPTEPSGADQLFAYAVVGFREPITR